MSVRVTFAARLLFFGLISLAVVGCGGGKNFSADDFKKVQKDMTEQQVKEILGSPKEDITSPDGNSRRLFWVTGGDKYYSISFDKDKKVIEPMAHGSREDYELMKGLMKMKI